MKHSYVLLVLICSVLSPSVAASQSFGHDMWTGFFSNSGLFSPHGNTCDSTTEVFVEMATSANLGFCMEKNERSSATFESARQTCAAIGKRLPEPVEFKFACLNYGGSLNDMTNNHEWSSNFPVFHLGDGNGVLGHLNHLSVSVSGDGDCLQFKNDIVASIFDNQGSNAYRCVR